jgi:transposase-like protein
MTVAENHELTDEVKDRVVELYLSGAKLNEILDATGVIRPTVYWILEKRGIKPSRQRAKPAEVNTDHLLQRLDAQARQIGHLEEQLAAKDAAIAELLSRLPPT